MYEGTRSLWLATVLVLLCLHVRAHTIVAVASCWKVTCRALLLKGTCSHLARSVVAAGCGHTEHQRGAGIADRKTGHGCGYCRVDAGSMARYTV